MAASVVSTPAAGLAAVVVVLAAEADAAETAEAAVETEVADVDNLRPGVAFDSLNVGAPFQPSFGWGGAV